MKPSPLAALAERANPIVLLEVRRGLRTKTFTVAFVLLLTISTLASLIAFGVYEAGSGSAGQGTFIALFSALCGVCFFMLPYTAFRSLVREREDKTWPLIVLTGLPPRRILAGKIGSTLLQALLYASVIAPFLLFAYLLQGVSLVVVGALLGAAFALHLFMTVAAVAAATLGESRLVRGAVHFVVLGALFFVTTSAFSFSAAMTTMHNASDVEGMLVGLGIAAWLWLSYGLILFAVAVSRLTFESDNHALWPRLALLLHFAGCAALALAWQAFVHTTSHLGLVLGILGLVHAFLAGGLVGAGRAGTSKRLRDRPPRVTLFGLLLPGAARGLRFSLLLIVLFAAVGVGLVLLEGRSRADREAAAVLLVAAFAVLYLAVPVALGRGPLRRLLPAPALTQALVFLHASAALGLPPLAALVAGAKPDHPGVNYLNPIFAVADLVDHGGFERVAVVWVLALAIFYVAHRLSSERDAEANRG